MFVVDCDFWLGIPCRIRQPIIELFVGIPIQKCLACLFAASLEKAQLTRLVNMEANQTGIDENPRRSSPAPLGQTIASDTRDEIQNSESEIRGNFFKIALFQITLRTGWIFKTESIVMPAVMDSISGAGWLRGFLPVLNRFGRSGPKPWRSIVQV